MRRRAAAALILAFASAPARAQEGGAAGLLRPGAAEGQEIAYSADNLVYDYQGQALLLSGNVVATRGAARLRAGEGRYDRAKGRFHLLGGVVAVEGRDIFLADSAVLDLNGKEAELTSAVLFRKDHPVTMPSGVVNREQVRAAGRNTLTLTGQRVRRLPGGGLLAEEVTLTPCDCAREPDYELFAPEARIEGDRANLRWPRLRLLGASLPLLAPISLPLTDRQSGLLFPRPAYAPVTGFGTEVPLFLVLNRSYDVTVAPGLFTGTGKGDASLNQRNMKGPRLGLQFRYAPSKTTRGQIDADLLRDGARFESLGNLGGDGETFDKFGEPLTRPGRGFGGIRGVVRFSHFTDLGGGTTLAAKGTAANDAMYIPDTEPSPLARFVDTLRTDVGLLRASGPWTAGAQATLLQDVRIPNANLPDRRLFGPERRHTFQRLPGAFLQLAPVRVGPAAFGFEASAVRFAPFGALDAQERATGFGPTDRDSGPAVESPDPLGLGRARSVRVDVSPRLLWGLEPGAPIALSAELGGRADAWFFDGDSARNRRRAYGLAGVLASLPLDRPYGGLLHTVSPEVEVRALSRALSAGGVPIGEPTDGSSLGSGVPAARRAYDEIDGAAPAAGEALATLRVRQALWRRGAPGRAPSRMASFDLQQDLVLWGGRGGHARAGELGANLGLQLGPFGWGAGAQYDWSTRLVTLARAGASLRDRRGDEIHSSLFFLRGGLAPPERIRAGIDELFASVPAASQLGDLSGSAGFGGQVILPLARHGLRFGYDAGHLLAAGDLPPSTPDWTHTVSLSYDTPCRCAGLYLVASFRFHGGTLLDKDPVIISVVLDLKAFGSFGTP